MDASPPRKEKKEGEMAAAGGVVAVWSRGRKKGTYREWEWG